MIMTALPEVDDLLDQDPERERIMSWQLARMLELGLTVYDAELLVSRRVDWHDVRRLIRSGCPVSMVARIA